jgi:two-component system, sensor histidine kinase PdtaS
MKNLTVSTLFFFAVNFVHGQSLSGRQADSPRQIQELEITYKTQQKKDSIEPLSQKSKLQKEELNGTQRTISEIIAGICVLLIGAGILRRLYRIKQKAQRIIIDQNELIIDKNQEIVNKNRELEGLLQEKEYLVQEIHHRVKNNLHTVLSFLTLQSKYLNGEALAAIKISRQRIYAMSLIHQKLYLNEDIKTIEIKSYLQEFITYFQDGLDPDMSINFVMDIDDVRLSVTKAIPVGLIVNEALTNSVKFAFPLRTEGVITIRLKIQDNLIALFIEDNGVGISLDANSTEFNSLGIKLIKGLCNDLDGKINFDSTAGTKITILFSAES